MSFKEFSEQFEVVFKAKAEYLKDHPGDKDKDYSVRLSSLAIAINSSEEEYSKAGHAFSNEFTGQISQILAAQGCEMESQDLEIVLGLFHIRYWLWKLPQAGIVHFHLATTA